jgi:hypothetical protein
MTRLLTAEQAVSEFNLPSTRTLRTMRARGLTAVRLGKAFLFDAADVEDFITASKETVCPAPTAAPRSNGSQSANRSTSSGTKPAESECVLLARQTAEKLKRFSRNSFASADSDQTSRVIRAKFGSAKS